MKRILCALLALAMLAGGYCMAEAAPAASDGPTYYKHDGRVTLIDGACVDHPVNSFEDAVQVIDGVIDQLGGDAQTRLDPWRDLTDAYGNHYYVFRQMHADTTVLGGAVKVVTDPAGTMLGLSSSIVSNLPAAETEKGITAAEAEQIVLDHARETTQADITLVEGLTDRMILPVALELDIEAEDIDGARYVWVVYTDNPDSRMDRSSDLPYLAHYVTLTGEYLYSLPTIMPNDEAGASGFDSSYVFEFMEPVDYTGYVDLSTGEEMELTVTVMRDKRTGMYYLGNLERRIVVADCWEYLYNGGRVVLAASPDNLEWDQVGLLSLYNYCRAYDYYKEIGWSGGDGLDTPILILNDYCDANHKPVNNAAYVGGYLGWQMFLASQGNDLSQCLDVLAHEFTHCVTGSVMTYNAYMNDFGAINEAMSDIQGKTCEMLMEGREEMNWTLGDEGTTPVRSLSDPHQFSQPEFTWDVYYMPNAKTPTELNDRGGVHTNSSLLNNLAWRLYEKGGMTLEEGRAFWFTVDCAMVPGTDYAQLAELLPWALRITGMEEYDAELRRALDATRLGVVDIPEVFDEDRALVTLNLPDNPIFDDEQWVLQIYTVNVEKLISGVKNIFGHLFIGDFSVLPPTVQAMLNGEAGEDALPAPAQEEKGLVGTLMDFFNGTEEQAEEEPSAEEAEELPAWVTQELPAWIDEYFSGVFYMSSTNAGQDGRTMRMVGIPGHSMPLLIHGIYNQDTSKLDDTYLLGYFGGQWYDLAAAMAEMNEEAEVGEDGLTDGMRDFADRLGEQIENSGFNFKNFEDYLDLLFFRVEGGVASELPATGLETITPIPSEAFDDIIETAEDAEPRMSRPKLEESEMQEAA